MPKFAESNWTICLFQLEDLKNQFSGHFHVMRSLGFTDFTDFGLFLLILLFILTENSSSSFSNEGIITLGGPNQSTN